MLPPGLAQSKAATGLAQDVDPADFLHHSPGATARSPKGADAVDFPHSHIRRSRHPLREVDIADFPCACGVRFVVLGMPEWEVDRADFPLLPPAAGA
ncbi:hypothetical protein [Kitasatospora purpeofusca]|uniref:hypothetical protein n=1 Tax=Kitasatospora purpeofusca TaxID=67352 RepID=UPI003654BCA4